MEKIITRFAPSPTGYLHVGGARTALFNWLYARHTQGRFILRIEDTDAVRSTQASVDAIFDALTWLGIDWDDGPFYQSERRDIYQDYLQRLIDAGLAYYCNCSQDKLQTMRSQAMARGDKPKYDGTCRNKGRTKAQDTVVRFKAPLTGTTVIEDTIKGRIVFQNDELDDFIIARSDGSPTYNFVVVVDDLTMGITTVIRGDDHVMNTPKQIQLYKALGHPLPIFGHVPMVLGNDRARLSKRHGAMSVTAYRDMGFLADAVINYLVRLGWSYGDQEFFTRTDLIEKFALENIGKAAGIFDVDKLLALNADHMKALPKNELAEHLAPFLKNKGCEPGSSDYVSQIVETLLPRSKTFEEMADQALFYYATAITYEEKAAKKFLKAAAVEPLQLLIAALQGLASFEEQELEKAFLAVMEQTGLKLGKIAQPVRVALTGRTASPGIFEIIAIIGKEKVLARLKQAINYIEKRGAET
jgi:glutamyl-tRNA synthetase